jgi:hypothetical protein
MLRAFQSNKMHWEDQSAGALRTKPREIPHRLLFLFTRETSDRPPIFIRTINKLADEFGGAKKSGEMRLAR